MQLLVLGGTDFLGRALGEAPLERGDEVATFTRGQDELGPLPRGRAVARRP